LVSAYDELYDRFIIAGANMTRDREWSDRIDTVTERTVSTLTASGSETEEYCAALKTFSGDLETAGNLDQIRGLVADIITETETMDTRTRELNSPVKKSTEEITDLRKGTGRFPPGCADRQPHRCRQPKVLRSKDIFHCRGIAGHG
jgi:hypothetical protein